MSFEQDEEILQDFLIEAGEILEALSEQLVELENNPDDSDLLNAIFRGFHTVKGGAGFLSFTQLVDACHGAENVFDILRNKQRKVTSELMDVILQALDTINEMFEQVKNREPLITADSHLLSELHRLSQPESSTESLVQGGNNQVSDPIESEPIESEIGQQTHADSADQSCESQENSEMTEEEFERLLDELQVSSSADNKVNNSSSTDTELDAENMTDEDFESLLDDLHGQGSFSSSVTSNVDDQTRTENPTQSDEMLDDEFEALLDELHGKGKGPKVSPISVTEQVKVENIQSNENKTPSPAQSNSHKNELNNNAKSKPSTIQGEVTVRVDTKRLDDIMNLVGELVLVRNRLTSLGIAKDDENLTKAVSNLDAVTTNLQGAVMKTRMQPIKKVFGRFPRVVRDLARSLNKEITLKLEGEETDLDKNLVEALADPLVHLVRNSVDHGIENPEQRALIGKPVAGEIVLSASQEGDHILLTIRDDGAGMNAEKLKEIAIDRGVLDADSAAKMSDKEAFSLIFAPGFSTKNEISEVSGRGVGMDVVKTKITQLNGSINIDSEIGVGTIIEIKVPLTLAILPTLMVKIGQQIFALPLASVNEIFHLDLTNTNIVDGQLTIIVREKAIPLFYLDQWLVHNSQPSKKSKGHVVLVQLGNKQVAFVVDSLIGQEEVVIKPLDKLLHGTPGMAGATITSDGGIALIIDVPSMLKHYVKKVMLKNRSQR